MPTDDLVKSALRRHVKAILETFELDEVAGARLLRRLADSMDPPAPEPAEPPPAAADDEVEVEALFEAIADDGPDDLPELEPVEVASVDVQRIRRHPRFPVDAPVNLHFAGRDQLRDVWMRDISKGGLFIEVDEPPPLDTELEVQLQTPDGEVRLAARVVHVVPPERADSMGGRPGVGVQFSELDEEARDAVERYVMGIEKQLRAEEEEPADEVSEAHGFVTRLRDGDIYTALEVDPKTRTPIIIAAMDALLERFGQEGPDAAANARLQAARAALKRFREVLSTPVRRLAYDFMNGHVRAEERMRETDPKLLRGVWARVFPERAEKAETAVSAAHAHAGNGDYDAAITAAERALEADPFLLNVRRAAEGWRGRRDIRRRMEQGDDPIALRALGVSVGLSPADLRDIWSELHPERVEEAKTHAKHALQAVALKRGPEAISRAEKALELDPFNLDLESAINQWRTELA